VNPHQTYHEKNSTSFNCFIFYSITAFAQNSRQRDIDAFIAQTGAVATTDKATNSLNFLRFPIGQALNLGRQFARTKSNVFSRQSYPGLFEKKDRPKIPIRSKKVSGTITVWITSQYSNTMIVYLFLMVYLKFHFDTKMVGLRRSMAISSLLREVECNSFRFERDQAGQRAIKLVTGQKKGKFSKPLKINKNTLISFPKRPCARV
jgi:hypothetical protein